MTKVAVLGNAGGGKTTLCHSLSAAKGLPLYHLDKLLWSPGWVPTPKEKFDFEHERILKKDKWIIDGMASMQSIERRVAEADTIIYIDLPLRVHYWWATKRQFKSFLRERDDFAEGCPMLPKTWVLIKMMWQIHYQLRPKIQRVVYQNSGARDFHHIQTVQELNQFKVRHCQR